MPEYRLMIPDDLDGAKLRLAALRGLMLSSGQYKRAKFEGKITLDGQIAHADAIVHAGQELWVFIPEKQNSLPAPVEGNVPVLFEDEHFWILDKPAPLPSAPSEKQTTITLENMVFAMAGQPGDFVYRPVNRLDKGTSGLMMVAKTARAQHLLQGMLHSDAFIREYLAVVEGSPEADEGWIDAPIAKVDGPSVKREVRPDGKEARTFYRVLQRGRRSLVRLRLDTGRTHQIRVHMAHLGCPVAGDFLYGTELPQLPGRFALHSAFIRIRHPLTGEWICRESPLPPALETLLTCMPG